MIDMRMRNLEGLAEKNNDKKRQKMIRGFEKFGILLFFFCGALTAPYYLPKEDWIQLSRATKDHGVKLTIAIKQTNTDWLRETLKAVSYPNSPRYGNYMNFDEIAKYVHGRPESISAVVNTLVSAGVKREEIDFTLGLDFAVVFASVEIIELVFSAEFYEYQHREESEFRIVKSVNYTLPGALRGHVDFVFGIKEFPQKPRLLARRSVNADNLGVDPKTLAKDYNTSGYISTNPANSQAVAAFLKQYFRPKDLEKFQTKYDLPVRPVTKTVGENDPEDAGAEAELDVQYISATGRNVSTWFISISTYANHGQEDFLSWVVGQINTTNSPWVHSASYGDIENSIDEDYLLRCNNEFMKFGVSGRSVLFAAGDSGVDCHGLQEKFNPMWPASSPYVTTVGGTTSLTEVWRDGGGGFSNVFPIPDYQKEIVKTYLESGKAPDTKHFNVSGRAYPDVSAFSVDYIIEYDGIPFPVSGTSCAAPTFAGLVSSLNDILLNMGKPTLGFLNPLLYQKLQGKGFIDVTEGANGGGIICPGFDAIQGWDPASGWGSPDFGLLADTL